MFAKIWVHVRPQHVATMNAYKKRIEEALAARRAGQAEAATGDLIAHRRRRAVIDGGLERAKHVVRENAPVGRLGRRTEQLGMRADDLRKGLAGAHAVLAIESWSLATRSSITARPQPTDVARFKPDHRSTQIVRAELIVQLRSTSCELMRPVCVACS